MARVLQAAQIWRSWFAGLRSFKLRTITPRYRKGITVGATGDNDLLNGEEHLSEICNRAYGIYSGEATLEMKQQASEKVKYPVQGRGLARSLNYISLCFFLPTFWAASSISISYLAVSIDTEVLNSVCAPL